MCFKKNDDTQKKSRKEESAYGIVILEGGV